MRKFITLLIALGFLTPAFASADISAPFQPTPTQLLTRIAALDAQIAAASSTNPVSCAAVFSAPQVTVGNTVLLAWGSVGSLPQGSIPGVSMWPQAGASTLSFKQAGNWTYSFTFYGANNATATCTASVKVTS